MLPYLRTVECDCKGFMHSVRCYRVSEPNRLATARSILRYCHCPVLIWNEPVVDATRLVVTSLLEDLSECPLQRRLGSNGDEVPWYLGHKISIVRKIPVALRKTPVWITRHSFWVHELKEI